jgi:hypothetical protein
MYLEPRALAFLSDRQKGLLEAISIVFNNPPYGYCLRHLYDNFHKQFKHPQLRSLLYEAACAITEEKYNTAIAKMCDINANSVDWLLSHVAPQHWCEFYFPRRRYGHLSSNIAESLNNWLLEARDKPILGILGTIRHQLMKWFVDRRQLDSNIEGILVSSAAKQIKNVLTQFARRYRTVESNVDVYEVFSPETISTLQGHMSRAPRAITS